MNSKTGGDLYRVAIPEYKNALIVGVDMISMGGGRAAKVLSCVATRSQTLTQCFSKAYRLGEPSVDEGVDSLKYQTLKRKVIKDLKRSEARAEALCSFLREAIGEYKKSTKGKNPEKIIIYRDGLGCLNEVNDRVISIEVDAVRSLLSTLSQGYSPSLLYCLVDRNQPHRLFLKDHQHQMINPKSGTCVDTGLVEIQGDRFYEFYLIPHNATVATAKPVLFKVVENTLQGVSKLNVETATYHLCFNYYNFAGPIKVPMVCMYARKLCQYMTENQIEAINQEKLCPYLYYL
jgi:aubergine-like protein